MILPFELDPQIIHHIIYSQAGSVGKAIIELLMNSVDAGATTVRLTMAKDGFHCSDDGTGFASREDVLRYFGRFGTPHQEGDATYGRFRLGRGQIMAHATTEWTSNSWLMKVDTRSMGYNYELDDLEIPSTGCSIIGTWYEPLSDLELMSATQEIRDLVRYTPISVELNGRVITRDPSSEKWDFEDEWAYYRAKEEGPVSIYNQGVLVRHDSSHVWGAGGLIVSKKALDLNVSRTEILRKTCKVWKHVAKEFGRLADAVSARLGDHRKTEARREKSARSLLSGDPNLSTVFEKEEVITLLPGKRHVTLKEFREKALRQHKGNYTIAEDGNDVPKGEAIAREGIIQVVHPKTLERFGCDSTIDFEEVLERALANVTADAQGAELRGDQTPWFWRGEPLQAPTLVAFTTLREAFLERTLIVDERKVLDKETRRAWTALRWCLQHYAGACVGARRYRDGTLCYDEKHMHILLGESNTAEAWTDGETYLAIDSSIVKRLRSDPLQTAAYIFGLIDHEVAHQGDSLACGHDEAFYQRYHDISLRMAPERQRFLHKWLMKYTMSMEKEGKKAGGDAWRERWLVDRVGSGREKRGLTPVIEDLSSHPLVQEAVPEQNMALLAIINTGLVQGGVCPAPPDWTQVLEQGRRDQEAANDEVLQQRAALKSIEEKQEREWNQNLLDARPRIAEILNLELVAIPENALAYLCECWVYGYDAESIQGTWAEMNTDPHDHEPMDFEDPEYDLSFDPESEMEIADKDDGLHRVDSGCRQYVKDGETWWLLERNTASAGFWRVEDYLKWRAANEAV
ncbi:ATP-binding protein [Pseudomonas sp. G(2018)]|uniref:ATP-binding protein n=1 Tax=Pseudomonas sp. G(2018) TaxID=2502242 RepID=UPI0010F5E55C|nr:ATP-binding protein [Pseudomonas sp. G(2018)]